MSSMTDMEMDLVLANARIKQLEEELAAARFDQSKKCSFGPGITIKPDGVNELDPCVYETVEIHRNVTVYVMRCMKCGHIELQWDRQEDTVDEDMEDGDF